MKLNVHTPMYCCIFTYEATEYHRCFSERVLPDLNQTKKYFEK